MKGKSLKFETVIGLEVHAQLKTNSKIFCGSDASFGANPNENTCTIDLGLPGVLPVLNKRVVENSIKLGLAVGAKISEHCRFARKHYFYPDLPKGYQISQYENPICEGGQVSFLTKKNEKIIIGLTRIHMEEDAGKLTHDDESLKSIGSLVDFNRAGVPLLEIVSEPELRSPEDAELYARKLRTLVRYLDICDGNMQEGSLRCDANISLRKPGEESFGSKVEIKNVNSFRSLRKALEFEELRQAELLEEEKSILQETRLWDESSGVTRSMRTKEYAHDYRYFPDPDLVPLEIDKEWISKIEKTLPELPDTKRERFVSNYKLPLYDSEVLTSESAIADYFEKTVKSFDPEDAKIVSNWVMGDIFGLLNEKKISIEDCPVTPANLAEMISLIMDGTINRKIAKEVFGEMAQSGTSAQKIVVEKGLKQISDVNSLEEVVTKILNENPEEVKAYKGGKRKLLGFFVGQIMKETQSKANPKSLQKILKKKLSE
ncbi:MAG: Asp-tRNA(Asn)/Glu-tRNA(Gln) amidotransferase subunit GatB [Nitrospinota bacterium]|nr:Asp-tRNA(Asn)/Glu-tRNA(Gln) amidotransferase subunit GatB [Nitrospinota bacterium]